MSLFFLWDKIVGFVLALALHRVRRFKKLYRTLLIALGLPNNCYCLLGQWILNEYMAIYLT